MPRQRIVETLVRDHQLDSEHAYLLNLIPIIEIMWADGRLQNAEISLLYEYTTQWLSILAADADGDSVVSTEQANAFITRFTQARPEPKLLASLKELSHQFMQAAPETMLSDGRGQQLIDFCLDISAAAVSKYPYERRSRITADGKVLIVGLIQRLAVSSAD